MTAQEGRSFTLNVDFLWEAELLTVVAPRDLDSATHNDSPWRGNIEKSRLSKTELPVVPLGKISERANLKAIQPCKISHRWYA